MARSEKVPSSSLGGRGPLGLSEVVLECHVGVPAPANFGPRELRIKAAIGDNLRTR